MRFNCCYMPDGILKTAMRTCFYQYHMPNGILTECMLEAKSCSDVMLVVIPEPALFGKSRRDVTVMQGVYIVVTCLTAF